MPIIGVTGGIGSGKSALTDRLKTHGIVVVDADEVARQIVEPGRPALADIADRFGTDIITAEGVLDRSALRHIVFNDPEARRDLEAITHPRIRDEISAQLAAATSAYVVLSSPLLIESGQVAMVDQVVVVDVPESLQVERTMARDHNDETLVRRILEAQLPREQRLAHADLVIDNSCDLDALWRQADQLHQRLSLEAQQTLND